MPCTGGFDLSMVYVRNIVSPSDLTSFKNIHNCREGGGIPIETADLTY